MAETVIHESESSKRDKIIIKTSVIGIITNVLLAIFKAVVGFISNSIAVILDAVNVPDVEVSDWYI